MDVDYDKAFDYFTKGANLVRCAPVCMYVHWVLCTVPGVL